MTVADVDGDKASATMRTCTSQSRDSNDTQSAEAGLRRSGDVGSTRTTAARAGRRRTTTMPRRATRAWPLSLWWLAAAFVELATHRQLLPAGAVDSLSLMDDSRPVDDMDNEKTTDPTPTVVLDQTAGGKDNPVGDASSTEAGAPLVDPLPIPASLRKATTVGATLREAHADPRQPSVPEPSTELGHDHVESNDKSEEPRAPLPGCPWGAVSCSKKGTLGPGGGGGARDANTSAADRGSEGDDAGAHPSASALAGSVNARIKNRVVKGHGRPTASVASVHKRVDVVVEPKRDGTFDEGTAAAGHAGPPQGFRLAGRVVTSLADGLSYFLDAPHGDQKDGDGDWLMDVPYAYLECGPTIESTTDAFALSDLSSRHSPASASTGHWTNIAGRIFIERDAEEEESARSRYIEGSREGRPKLVVALSPIEITVSGNNEESRIFHPGDVILMEDTLGKGHKMRAAPADNHSPRGPGRDLSILMVSLPHSVHFPTHAGSDETVASARESDEAAPPRTSAAAAAAPPSHDAHQALYGFAPPDLHPRQPHKRSPLAASKRKPCPLDYDSVYSSLFFPHTRHQRGRRRRRKEPGTYASSSGPFDRLPPLRSIVFWALGLAVSGFIAYILEEVNRPWLVYALEATTVGFGAWASWAASRNWVANLAEKWRWEWEVGRMRKEGTSEISEVNAEAEREAVGGDASHRRSDADSGFGRNVSSSGTEPGMEA